MVRWISVFVLASAVSGGACKPKAKKKEDAGVPVAPPADGAAADAAEAPPVDAAAAVVPDAPSGAWIARDNGVGPIDDKTPANVKAVKKLFPEHDVKKVSIPMGEGDLKEVYIGVSKGKTLILKLVGDDNLLHVDIMTNDVWNPWGVQIGMTFAEAEKLVGKLSCSDGGDHTDWRDNIAECTSDKTGNYGLDFTSDEGGKAKELIEKPDQLAKAKLVALRWEVPGNGPPLPGQ